MTQIGLVILSDTVTFFLSLLMTMFIAGKRFGEMVNDVKTLKGQVNRIEGMFTVKLREEHIDKG